MPEHTIAENLTRLQNAKTAIGTAITAKGGTVTSGDGFEDFPADINTITSLPTGIEIAKLTSIPTSDIAFSNMYIANDITNNTTVVFGRCKTKKTGQTASSTFQFTYPETFTPIAAIRWAGYLYGNYNSKGTFSQSTADTQIILADNSVSINTTSTNIKDFYLSIVFKAE